MKLSKLLSLSAIVATFGILSSVLGLGFDLLTLKLFGLGAETDALLIGNTIPLLIGSIMVAGYQPAIVAAMRHWDYGKVRLFLGRLILFSILLTLGCSISAPLIVAILAPGLGNNHLTILTTAVLGWTIPLLVIGEIGRALLQGSYRFTASILSLFFANLAGLLMLIVGVGRYGYGAAILARWVRALILCGLPCWWAWRCAHWQHTPQQSNQSTSDQFYASANTATAAYISLQASFLLPRLIASYLPVGTIAAFEYGWRLLSHISQWFIFSPITVAMPALASPHERLTTLRTLQRTITAASILLTVIILVAMLVFRSVASRLQISSDLYMVSDAIVGLSLGLLSTSVLRLIHSVYIATFQPDRLGIVVIVTIIGAVLATPIGLLGIFGLTMSSFISLTLGAVVGLKLLNHESWRKI